MIEVDSISAQKLLTKLSLVDKTIETRFSEFLDSQARILETKVKQRLDSVGAIDTGQAKQGIHSQHSGLEAEVRSNTLHSSIIEYGRRPGTYPPSGPLERWAQRKGIDMPVFVLQRSIKNKGIKARPFFYVTWSDYKGQFNVKMVSLFKRIVAGK